MYYKCKKTKYIIKNLFKNLQILKIKIVHLHLFENLIKKLVKKTIRYVSIFYINIKSGVESYIEFILK